MLSSRGAEKLPEVSDQVLIEFKSTQVLPLTMEKAALSLVILEGYPALQNAFLLLL